MKKVITEQHIIELLKKGEREIAVAAGEILTPLAKDRIKSSGMKIVPNAPEKKPAPGSGYIGIPKIVIGCDHTGLKLKNYLVEHLKKNNVEVFDVGTFSEESVDYPDIALNVAKKVKRGEATFGILIDASGIPSAITANKLRGIRAATCYNEFSARSSREHNNANILVLGAKALGDESAKSITDAWLSTEFAGGRHQRRLDKITDIENNPNL